MTASTAPTVTPTSASTAPKSQTSSTTTATTNAPGSTIPPQQCKSDSQSTFTKSYEAFVEAFNVNDVAALNQIIAPKPPFDFYSFEGGPYGNGAAGIFREQALKTLAEMFNAGARIDPQTVTTYYYSYAPGDTKDGGSIRYGTKAFIKFVMDCGTHQIVGIAWNGYS